MSERTTGMAATQEDVEREGIALQLRAWSQCIGLSSPESWEEISEPRRDQWRRFAEEIMGSGRAIVDAARVPTDDELAAIRAIVADDGVPAESVEWFAAFDTLRAFLERQR